MTNSNDSQEINSHRAERPQRSSARGVAATIVLLLLTSVGLQVFQLWRSSGGAKWEYAIVAPSDILIEDELTRLGSEGWEIVAARRATSAGGYSASYELILKRPATPKALAKARLLREIESHAQAQETQPEVARQPGTAPGRSTHDVNMVLEGTAYRFVPSEVTIRKGHRVTFHNVSGGPHNVQFWPDSIPPGAAEPLGAGMPDQMAPLAGPLLVEPNATYTVTFANTPVGEYKFFCLPYLANNMVGKITVTP